MAVHPTFERILDRWRNASVSRAGPPPDRPDLAQLGVALACRVISEHDPENQFADAGCYECTLGTVPKDKETGPCLYHAACEVVRAAGLEP